MSTPTTFHNLHPEPERRIREIMEQRHPLSLLLDGVADVRNIGGLFRLADAARLGELIYLGAGGDWAPGKKEKRISRSTTNYVPFRGISSLEELPEYSLLLLEWTDKSTSIWDFKPAPDQKYLLALGHEETGISRELLDSGAPCLHIPMYGMNSSMNVTQAAAIATYCLLEKLTLKTPE